ncbi:hypothetical protein G9464_06165 [Halostella sp. JP-L12]|uniref:hypothetical protein n=1 Tax=Halostella TaxID=1843185 RepID=UPI000EF84DE2|nr:MULTISPECIES: hypothetical protein [Halostella]NHN47183.1 hypothetical protein [Halostella sp. JP-L12]
MTNSHPLTRDGRNARLGRAIERRLVRYFGTYAGPLLVAYLLVCVPVVPAVTPVTAAYLRTVEGAFAVGLVPVVWNLAALYLFVVADALKRGSSSLQRAESVR